MAKDTRASRYEKNRTPVSTKVPVKKQVSKARKGTKKPVEINQKKKNKRNVKVTATQKKKVSKKKHVKIRYRNVFFALIIILVLGFGGYYFLSLPITNIYLEGNTYFSDQALIDMAHLSNYPSNVSVLPSKIEKELESEELIANAKVTKIFRKIVIKITENHPLYYYESHKKTVLEDGRESTQTFLVPTVINYIPDTQYEQFLKVMKKIEKEVLNRISEIKYDPDEVDTGRFLLSMRDGNYVYLTLTKWDAINSYVSIIKEFPNQKGILYLNAGNSFEVIEK